MNKGRVYYNEGLRHFKNNNINTAIESFEVALKYNKNEIDTLNLLGLCKYIVCDFKEANFYWCKSLKIKEVDNKANEYILVFKKGLIEKYNKGIRRLKDKEYDESIEIFKEIAMEYGELVEPYYILGVLYLNEKKFKEASKYFLKVVSVNKENRKGVEGCNYILSRKKDIRKVEVVVICISILLGVYFSIKIFSFKNKIEVLGKNYNTAVEKYKEENRNLIVDKEQKSIKIEESELLTKDEKTVFNEGIIFFNSKKYEKAIERFRDIQKYGVKKELKAESTYYTALSLEKLKEYSTAIKMYTKYIDEYYKENYYDDSIYNCGILLYKIGEKEKSKKILKKLESIPESIFYNTITKNILMEKIEE